MSWFGAIVAPAMTKVMVTDATPAVRVDGCPPRVSPCSDRSFPSSRRSALAAPLAVSAAGAPSRFVQDPYPSTYTPIASAPVLIRNATVLTGTGRRLDGADVLLQDGKVAAIGTALQAPADATVVDGTGKWVTPGIIDVHSHLGVYASPAVSAQSDGNEATSPTTPNVWAEHSIWPQDPGFLTALAGGITTCRSCRARRT